MGRLHQSFTKQAVSTLSWMYVSFPESTALHAQIERLQALPDDSAAAFEELQPQLEQASDALYAQDPAVLEATPFFRDCDLSALYDRLEADERPLLWKRLCGLCKMGSLVTLCGTHVPQVEHVAARYLESHPQTGDLSAFHKGFFKELLGQPDVLKQLIRSFTNRDSVRKMLRNCSDIMRQPGAERIDLEALFGALPEESELKEMQEQFEDHTDLSWVSDLLDGKGLPEEMLSELPPELQGLLSNPESLSGVTQMMQTFMAQSGVLPEGAMAAAFNALGGGGGGGSAAAAAGGAIDGDLSAMLRDLMGSLKKPPAAATSK